MSCVSCLIWLHFIFSGSSLLVRHIIKQEGIQGLFHGLNATFAREMPGYFFFFGGYETCRMLLTPAGKTKDDLSKFTLYDSRIAILMRNSCVDVFKCILCLTDAYACM